jgi:hypothetical protein
MYAATIELLGSPMIPRCQTGALPGKQALLSVRWPWRARVRRAAGCTHELLSERLEDLTERNDRRSTLGVEVDRLVGATHDVSEHRCRRAE